MLLAAPGTPGAERHRAEDKHEDPGAFPRASRHNRRTRRGLRRGAAIPIGVDGSEDGLHEFLLVSESAQCTLQCKVLQAPDRRFPPLRFPVLVHNIVVNWEETMARTRFGELEEQVILALLRLEGESYAVPVARELARLTGRDVSTGDLVHGHAQAGGAGVF